MNKLFCALTLFLFTSAAWAGVFNIGNDTYATNVSKDSNTGVVYVQLVEMDEEVVVAEGDRFTDDTRPDVDSYTNKFVADVRAYWEGLYGSSGVAPSGESFDDFLIRLRKTIDDDLAEIAEGY